MDVDIDEARHDPAVAGVHHIRVTRRPRTLADSHDTAFAALDGGVPDDAIRKDYAPAKDPIGFY
jgi:hypothetical protein